MSALKYRIVRCSYAPTGSLITGSAGASLTATSGWTVLDSHEEMRNGLIAIEDDAKTRHYFSAYIGLAKGTTNSVTLQLWDATNSKQISGTLYKSGAAGSATTYFALSWSVAGPLPVFPAEAWPTGKAQIQLRYQSVGTASWYGAVFVSARL